MACDSRAGLEVLAFTASFPAAMQKGKPCAVAAETAESSAADTGPPRDMLTTAGVLGLAAARVRAALIPEIMSDVAADPSSATTLIMNILACLATPTVLPAAVPATCVPSEKIDD